MQYQTETEELIFYVGEKAYKEELEARGFEVHLEERRFGISATMIRENPSKYWKYIAQPFRRQFTKKVLIMGSASNGKTTLAKDLARFYDAPVSLEYAREYQIKNNVRDDELTPKDYYYLLLGQYDQTSKLIDSSANRGLVIADTNSLVTKGYYDYYMEVEGQDTSMTDTFDNLFVSILSKEKWDLILFVQPIGSYVNDGFRDMTMADEEIRTSFSNYLDQLRQQYLGNIPTTFLASDYLGNYEEAKKVIDAIYQAD
ncbi:MAG: AAA family ATPase [Streptococcus parasanguinis]|nr:AAA family ATPase [Streptococcus parasanguinis]